MLTKKQQKTSYEVKYLMDTFKSQKWIRYHEVTFNKKPYYKKIIFTFPNKIKTSTPIKREDYLLWRRELMKLTK